jgi:hypothetical protein
MNASPRGGYARGTTPRSPGDLTARIHRENLRKAEAASHVEGAGDPFESGFAAGWNKGFDIAFDAGFEAALRQLRDAGIDVAAVLALDDAEDEDED